MISLKHFRLAFVLFLTVLTACTDKEQSNSGVPEPEQAQTLVEQSKPANILLIVADDLGYTDLGVFGSEIPTPNIDKLAAGGQLLTSFYSAPNCSPTRSMLLSGTDSHIAGLGNMYELMSDNQRDQPGYEGYLHPRVATLAEVLGENGYSTFMTGKWHLGFDEESSPSARGFQQTFTMLEGGAGHLGNMLPYTNREAGEVAMYRENGKMITSLPDDFYSSKFYAEKMIDYIAKDRESGKPFFGYLSFTAPHWPLQAPKESIARHKGKYDAGWDDLLKKRNAGLQATGVIAEGIQPSSNLLGVSAWDDLSEEEKAVQARTMEVYAAMIEDIDVYTGKVIEYLKSIGEYDNTLIVFMSDNGAEGHGAAEASATMLEYIESCCDNSVDNIGAANSYVWPGSAWARASVGPWKLFKGFLSEGGIRVPALIHYPKSIASRVNNDFATVKDVMPTILDFLGIDHPAPRFLGRDVAGMQGESLLPSLTGKESGDKLNERLMGWELFGKIAVRHGDWKLLQQPESDHFNARDREGEFLYTWRLYNLADDPIEQHDLSERNPEKLQEMLSRWETYRDENSVVLPINTFGY